MPSGTCGSSLVFALNLSYLFLKLFIDVASTTSSGRLFHRSTTRLLKNFLYFSVLVLFLKIFRWWPLSTPSSLPTTSLLIWKKYPGSTLSKPWMILNVSIMSPLFLLSSRVVRPSLSNLSSYGRCLNAGTSFVALLCTCSNTFISLTRVGAQACTQYSRWGLTYTLYSVAKLSYVQYLKVCFSSPSFLFAVAAALAMCFPNFMEFDVSTPKSFSSFTT